MYTEIHIRVLAAHYKAPITKNDICHEKTDEQYYMKIHDKFLRRHSKVISSNSIIIIVEGHVD